MSTEYVQSSIHVTKQQKKYVQDNYINLSKLTRAGINNLMKKSEGRVMKDQPTEDTKEESVIV